MWEHFGVRIWHADDRAALEYGAFLAMCKAADDFERRMKG